MAFEISELKAIIYSFYFEGVAVVVQGHILAIGL
jgi:hypothetical protein